MAQETIGNLFLTRPATQVTGSETVPIDVPTVTPPTQPTDFQTKGVLIQTIAAYVISKIPTATSSTPGLMPAAAVETISGLSDVATSGKYSDLSGTPDLSDVATSGSASDLSFTTPIGEPVTVKAAGTFNLIMTPPVNTGSAAAAQTIDFSKGAYQVLQLVDSVDTTLTFTNPALPCLVVIGLQAPSSGTIPGVTMPSSVIGSPTIPSDLATETTTLMFFDGTKYVVLSASSGY